MTPFTLCMAYYDNADMLRAHFSVWRDLPWDIRENLHVVIVDDGSVNCPADGVATANLIEWTEVASFQLYRIDAAIDWGQDVARNIAVKHAPEGWLLLTDMDHIVPEQTWGRLMRGPLSKKTAYRFSRRVTAPSMTNYHAHPNSWAMTSKTYWKVGGYDERLAGYYGSDGDILNRVRKFARLDELDVPLVRVPREHIADASTTTLTRKNPEDKRRINEIIHARNAAGLNPLHFQFPYHRVL